MELARDREIVPVTHRRLLTVAVPMTLGYISTPLVGVVAIGVIGQSGDAAMTGGVALASLVTDLVFSTCNFLRSGTTGLAAQAVGRGDRPGLNAILVRALIVSVLIGLALLALTPAILALAPGLLAAGPDARGAMVEYLHIRLLAAPLVLANFALFGWLLGQGRSGLGLVIQTLLNGTNIALALIFAGYLGWGIAGAGWAAVIADMVALVAGLAICGPGLTRQGLPAARTLLEPAALMAFMRMNGDIMVRTFVLLGAFAIFARQGASQGDVVLSANALLEKLYLVAGYFLDGISAAAETFVGQAVGARRRDAYDRALALSLGWSGTLALGMAVAVWFGGGVLIRLLTTNAAVLAVAFAHLPWAAMSPLAGFLAFTMDGVFIGATWTRDMRWMMILSLVLFLAAMAVLMPAFGNHGLWAAFLIFLGARGVSLGLVQRRRARETFAGA